MIASREELAEMQRALLGALGHGSADEAPTPVLDWRRDWASLTELGLSIFCLPEDVGGFGREVSGALVASRALGAVLHGSPYPALVAASYALARGLDPAERKTTCDDITSGRCAPTLAFLDSSARIDRGAGEVRVHGCARVVLGAVDADGILVLPEGSSEMIYVASRESVSIGTAHPFDVTRSVADVSFEGAAGVLLMGGLTLRETTEHRFGLLLAADAIGGTERMLERTRLFALEREAFGRPIGGFQAVQHRLVDHAVRLRGMTLLATEAADRLTRAADDAERYVLLAESAVSSQSLSLLHDLVQLTGGIGFTWEHGLHFYERRVHVDARLGRNPRAARRALARTEGWSTVS